MLISKEIEISFFIPSSSNLKCYLLSSLSSLERTYLLSLMEVEEEEEREKKNTKRVQFSQNQYAFLSSTPTEEEGNQ